MTSTTRCCTSCGWQQCLLWRTQVVCDGMYSALRKKLSAPRITHPSYFVGLLLRGCSLPHANFGHVVLAKPSPILFYPISSTEVRPASSGRLDLHVSPRLLFDFCTHPSTHPSLLTGALQRGARLTLVCAAGAHPGGRARREAAQRRHGGPAGVPPHSSRPPGGPSLGVFDVGLSVQHSGSAAVYSCRAEC